MKPSAQENLDETFVLDLRIGEEEDVLFALLWILGEAFSVRPLAEIRVFRISAIS